MALITLANGTRFVAEPGATLLDAASAQGVVLEHSCRTGRCGSCKAKVTEGAALPLKAASALTPLEVEAGWVLTCAHEAATDLALDIEDLNALAGISAKTVPARIDTLDLLAPDVLRITLRLPPTANFRFLAGQYIDVTGPAGVKRSYSIASDAAAPGKVELQVRRVPDGQFSAYWFAQAQVNDLLRFHGPLGTFFLRSVAGMDLVFLATGTGIAPIKSMLSQLAALAAQPASDRPASVTLLWGGRREEDLYWDPRDSLSGLVFVPVLSRAAAPWSGQRGYVQDVLLARSPSLANSVVYACGSAHMIDGARQQLTAAGLPPKRFFYDAFVSSN